MRRIQPLPTGGRGDPPLRTEYSMCVGNGHTVPKKHSKIKQCHSERSEESQKPKRNGKEILRLRRRMTKRREQNSPNSGTLRREQAPALLYYNRHFPYQGNHPALPAGIRNYTVGNGLDRSD